MFGLLKSLVSPAGAQLSPDEAATRLRHDAVLVDVREAGEFAAVHVKGAVHLPLGQLRAGGPALLDARLPPATREVVLVCQSGLRSRIAQSSLSGKDGRTYFNLTGGMNAWQARGLPSVRRA